MFLKYTSCKIALVLILTSCGEDVASNSGASLNDENPLVEGDEENQRQNEIETVPLPHSDTNILASAVNLVTDLPDCSTDILGKVIYVSSENVFYYCEGGEWQGIPTATQTFLAANYSCTGFLDVFNPFGASLGTNAYDMNSRVNYLSIQVLTDGTVDILAKEILYDINDEFMDFATTPFKFYPVQQSAGDSPEPASTDELYEDGSNASGSDFPTAVSSFASSQTNWLFTIGGTYYYFVAYREGAAVKIRAFNKFIPDITEYNNQQTVTCDTIYER